jgi:hypothetical protein
MPVLTEVTSTPKLSPVLDDTWEVEVTILGPERTPWVSNVTFAKSVQPSLQNPRPSMFRMLAPSVDNEAHAMCVQKQAQRYSRTGGGTRRDTHHFLGDDGI